MTEKSSPFWQTVPLADMSEQQWESLCDGCGRCCLLKLEDADVEDDSPERFVYTSVACRLMDCNTGRCRSYSNRLSFVPDCLVLTPETLLEQKSWMPETCAYRRLAEGKELPEWHPLRTGNTDTVVHSGYSIVGWSTSEEELLSEESLTCHVIAPFHLGAHRP